MTKEGNIQQAEQSINQVVTLKAFVDSIKPVWQALTGAASEELKKIRQVCMNCAQCAGLTCISFVTPRITRESMNYSATRSMKT
jgi:hypothetical protein